MSHIVPYLSEKQLQAIELLILGQNFRDIALTLGVDRRTLWRWRQMPEFQQAMAERRSVFHDEIHDRMGEIMRLSLLSVERELKRAENPANVNPLATALTMLRLAQPHRLFLPVTDEPEI